jgi:type VI protein secretion system component VasK
MFNLKTLAIAALAVILGVIGLSLVFSDVGAGESATSRIIFAAIFFLLCGLGIGYFNPRAWIISGLSAWGSTLFGAFLTFVAIRRYGSNAFAAQEPPYISAGLVILLVPLCLALLGGYIGRRLNGRRAEQTA